LGAGRILQNFGKNKEKSVLMSLSTYVLWHLWKEINRRIFKDCNCSPDGLLADKSRCGELNFSFVSIVTFTIYPLINAKGELLVSSKTSRPT
jgi:hypothetical protein